MKEIIVAVVQNGKKILLLHRSKNKQFDPDKWEFISGFIKDNPDLALLASNQVVYETGLKAKLVETGPAFEVNDDYGKWLIHPFLFNTTSAEVILQPEDHTEFCWVLPLELKNFDTVKDLTENLKVLEIEFF